MIRRDFGALLRALRGPYRPKDVAAALGKTRQAVDGLENRAEVSMTRMEWLEDFYGVDFHVTAVDRATGRVIHPVEAESPAAGAATVGLVARIEGALVAQLPDERRKTPPALAAERSVGQSGQPATPAVVTESAGERRTRAG